MIREVRKLKKVFDDELNELFPAASSFWISLLLIFAVVFYVHNSSIVLQSGDSRWSIPTALSIINEGNTNLDEYKDILEADSFECIEKVGGHYYTYFPIGASIIALPIVYIGDKFFDTYDFVNYSMSQDIEVIRRSFALNERFIASLIVAITAMLIYVISRRFLDGKYCLAVAFIFAFCTSAWSTASRALWQQGPTMLMITLALFIILKAKDKPKIIQFVSIPLFFSYVIRPTNSISILFLSIYILIQYRQYFLKYVLWGLIVITPFLIYNFNVYSEILSPYYQPQRIGSNPDFWNALLANLVSPGRGLLVFTPVIFASVIGLLFKIKNKQTERLDYFLVAIILFHWLAISSFPYWTAGWSFGPRFFSDMIPYFMYYLILMFMYITRMSLKSRIASSLIILSLLMPSFFIHYRGATDVETFIWNADLDGNTSKVWDWDDPEFMRGFKSNPNQAIE